MKSPKLFFFFILLLIFANCRKRELPINTNNDLIPKGNIGVILQFENEFGQRIYSPFPKVQINLEKDGIVQSIDSDSIIYSYEFNDLEWGKYNLSISSSKYGTCRNPILELNENKTTYGIPFSLKGIPNSSFESIQIDSFIDNRFIYWSCSLTPVTGKPLAVRFYYGDNREVTKDNYIYTSAGGGWVVFDYYTTTNGHQDRININDFSTSSDSIFIAAYIAAAGYERCIGSNMGLDDFSPVAEPPTILAIEK